MSGITSIAVEAPAGLFEILQESSDNLLLSNTSSGLGLIPLTFCPLTGRISTNLLADVLLIAITPGLDVSSLSQCLIYTPYLDRLGCYYGPPMTQSARPTHQYHSKLYFTEMWICEIIKH